MNKTNAKVLERMLSENDSMFYDMCEGDEWDEILRHVAGMYNIDVLSNPDDPVEALGNLCARMWLLGAMAFDDTDVGNELNRLLADIGMDDGDDLDADESN